MRSPDERSDIRGMPLMRLIPDVVSLIRATGFGKAEAGKRRSLDYEHLIEEPVCPFRTERLNFSGRNQAGTPGA
jgi:hypothetical protein